MVGKARKDKKTKKERTKCSSEQIMLMTQCYNAGAKDKSKRFTAEMCQKEMIKDPSIGHENMLTVSQIKGFWSRLHSKVMNGADIQAKLADTEKFHEY